jgi:hypothetical protein
MHGHSGTSDLFTVKNILPALHTKTTFGDDIYYNPSTAPIAPPRFLGVILKAKKL